MDNPLRRAAAHLAHWLSLAAAPTFALMAALAATAPVHAHQMSCSSAASPMSGMMLMYALMCAFHASPWLRLISRRRGAAHVSWPLVAARLTASTNAPAAEET